MLRQIRLRNFVKFNGNHEHRLDFPKNGVYIFLGENNTGKSCLFEGVRRCMHTELNASISSRHNPDNTSYVICSFEGTKSFMLTSCFVSYKDGNDTVFCKITFYKSNNGTIITRSIRKTEKEWGGFNEGALSDDKDTFYELGFQLLDLNNKDEIDSNSLEEFCKTLTNNNNDIGTFNKSFEQIKFETMFAYRGINPIQTLRQIPTTEGPSRYKRASDLAYVIKSHLNDPKECTDDESQYLRWLTEPQTYTFELSDEYCFDIEHSRNYIMKLLLRVLNIGKLLMSHILKRCQNNTDTKQIMFRKNNDKPVSILKVPEGILEAKVMSITLSRKSTTTLLIEEPGRGMHPSMIDCLRDLVLYDINKEQKKTVIFTTHNQRFIGPWTFEKIFYFYSCDSGSKVVTLGHAIEEVNRKEYLWSDHVSPIFFSKRVIMVEGADDIRFFDNLKHILLTEESTRLLVCGNNPGTDMQLRKFLTSLHIIAMGGKGLAKSIEPLCEALKLTERQRQYYLFDSDALLTIKSFIMKNKLNKIDFEHQKLQILEKNGIFVWFAYTDNIVEKFEDLKTEELKNYGRLEEAVRVFCKTHDKTYHEQNNRTCSLRDCDGMALFLNQHYVNVANSNTKLFSTKNNINYVKMRQIVKRIVDISMTNDHDCYYKNTIFRCPFKRLLQFLVEKATQK
ncbi:uncharacterized protein LOC143082248 [Mytilus galloprovincialis]|uniref:uncharacterized protein LOC143082248 n=1 Tax=Mytilus galloprovincialis TaxID=29158 RepID=UPI003F7B8886